MGISVRILAGILLVAAIPVFLHGQMAKVVGYLFAMFLIEPTIWNLAWAFIIFRLLDILKPPPINRVQEIEGGTGIMMDDVVAGLFTNFIIRLIQRFGILY